MIMIILDENDSSLGSVLSGPDGLSLSIVGMHQLIDYEVAQTQFEVVLAQASRHKEVDNVMIDMRFSVIVRDGQLKDGDVTCYDKVNNVFHVLENKKLDSHQSIYKLKEKVSMMFDGRIEAFIKDDQLRTYVAFCND